MYIYTLPSREAWEERQNEIRERAYFLWKGAGQPNGQDAALWALAEYSLNQEKLASATRD